MNLCLATAWDAAYAQFGAMCAASLYRYRAFNPLTLVEARQIKAQDGKPPSWAKIDLLLELLPRNDVVLWIDADALLLSVEDLRPLFADVHDLYIAEDCNGINCGVMAWRRSNKALEFLEGVRKAGDGPKRHHIWWEQAAIMERLHELSWKSMPKQVFNAYEGEIGPSTRIAHMPGMSLDERLVRLRELVKKCNLVVSEGVAGCR